MFKKQQLKREQPQIEKFEDVESDDVIQTPEKKRKKRSPEYLQQKQIEETNKLRKKFKINVKGAVENVKPVETFKELFQRYRLYKQLVENIKSFNYRLPTPVQMQVLPLLLEQKAVKVVAPTGSGKSCYSGLSEIRTLSNNILI